MRTVPQSITDAWLSGDFTGSRQPFARVTVQKMQIQLQKVDANRLFATALFGQGLPPAELPNVKSIEWSRSVGSDIGECTVTFYNTSALPLGQHPVPSGDFDQPGYYTYSYGMGSFSNPRWGTATNPWANFLMPDRILRTYEGYGYDPAYAAEKDPHLVQTGVWLIDEVEYTTDGLIVVTCRDLARLLVDHIIWPPVIPKGEFYPMLWEPYRQVPDPVSYTTTGAEFRPTWHDDSGTPYYGRNGSIHGHKPSDAFDSSSKTYWLSVGNAEPDAGYSFEFVEGNCGGRTVHAVKVQVYGGPYRMYVSVKIKGVWQGKKTIPYDRRNPVSAPNGSDIKYSTVQTVARESTTTVAFTHPVANVEAIRISFTNLFNSKIGPYKFRAGVRTITCLSSVTKQKNATTHQEGNYGDYTDIVKFLLAAGGFHWPNTALGYIKDSRGAITPLRPADDDPFLLSGRIWGDLENSGTTQFYDPVTGIFSPLDASVWDKKPLLDGINTIRDILGFVFFIDETGGVVWRMPNTFKIGNYIGDFAYNSGYTSTVLTIDEKQTLLSLHAKISSKNVREHIFVGDAAGTFGAVAAGYNPVVDPNPGLRRVGGWTDQNFKDVREAQKMADMITMQQAFTWRTDSLQITANPAIQIDDQVRIYERISNEGYLHYVQGIKSSNDLENGKWTYDLTTNWLGETPFTRWAFDPFALSQATQDYLNALRWKLANYTTKLHLSNGGALVMHGVKVS